MPRASGFRRPMAVLGPALGAAHINLSLRMMWRRLRHFAKEGRGSFVVCGSSPMSPEALNSLFSLCIGFAVAGALASGYQHRFAAVPFLVFAAPFIIMRNTLRGARIERRRFEFVMMATVIAGFWSMMSGTFFVMTLRAAGVLV
jgi:hypothetical protein